MEVIQAAASPKLSPVVLEIKEGKTASPKESASSSSSSSKSPSPTPRSPPAMTSKTRQISFYDAPVISVSPPSAQRQQHHPLKNSHSLLSPPSLPYHHPHNPSPMVVPASLGTVVVDMPSPNNEPAFPVKLHQLLSSRLAAADSTTHDDDDDSIVVQWQPDNDGRSFTILNCDEFEAKILPRLYYNRSMTIESFGRMLSLYGFQRVEGGPFEGDYYHTMFVKDKPHLAHMIRKTNGLPPSGPNPHPTASPTSYNPMMHPASSLQDSLASSMQASVASRLRGLGFAGKLHYLLSHGIYDLALERVIRWQPGGHSFAVYSQEEFEMQGLAQMLGTPGFSSFRAQLTLHGFQRVRSHGDPASVEAYYHAEFVREQPQLCHLIRSRNPGHLQSVMMRRGRSASPPTAGGGPLHHHHRLVSPIADAAIKEFPNALFVEKNVVYRRENHLDLTQSSEPASPPSPTPKEKHQQLLKHLKGGKKMSPSSKRGEAKPRKRPRVGHMMAQNYFPFKLHSVLTLAEKFGFEHLMTWAPHGRCFSVNDKDLFCDAVLPLFRHSEFASFRAQLKAYGFVRISRNGPDKGSYFHTCFLRGKPELCATITRRPKNVNGTVRGRPKGQKYVEPDFYKLKFLPQSNTEGPVDPPPGSIKDILEAALTQITPPAVVTREVHLPKGALGDMEIVKLAKEKPSRAPTKHELFFQKAKDHDVNSTLPVKLHKLLNDALEHDFDSIICWNEAGRSFSIVDDFAFQELLVTSWLDLPSFAAFKEELKLHGFKRRESGPGLSHGAFYHEMFHKALPHLCRCIKKQAPAAAAQKPAEDVITTASKDSKVETAANENITEISVSSSVSAASRASSPELEAAMVLSVMDSPKKIENATGSDSTSIASGDGSLKLLVHTADMMSLPRPPLAKSIATPASPAIAEATSNKTEEVAASTKPEGNTTITVAATMEIGSATAAHQDPPGRYD